MRHAKWEKSRLLERGHPVARPTKGDIPLDVVQPRQQNPDALHVFSAGLGSGDTTNRLPPTGLRLDALLPTQRRAASARARRVRGEGEANTWAVLLPRLGCAGWAGRAAHSHSHSLSLSPRNHSLIVARATATALRQVSNDRRNKIPTTQ